MDIKKSVRENSIVYSVSGRLEVVTAPQLDAEVRAIPADAQEVVFDFTELEYVSSAGLRVILQAQKTMQARKGVFKLKGVNAMVKKVLDITGFTPLLTFE